MVSSLVGGTRCDTMSEDMVRPFADDDAVEICPDCGREWGGIRCMYCEPITAAEIFKIDVDVDVIDEIEQPLEDLLAETSGCLQAFAEIAGAGIVLSEKNIESARRYADLCIEAARKIITDRYYE